MNRNKNLDDKVFNGLEVLLTPIWNFVYYAPFTFALIAAGYVGISFFILFNTGQFWFIESMLIALILFCVFMFLALMKIECGD